MNLKNMKQVNKVDTILNNFHIHQLDRLEELTLGSECDGCSKRSLKGTYQSLNEGEDQVLDLFYCLECAPK